MQNNIGPDRFLNDLKVRARKISLSHKRVIRLRHFDLRSSAAMRGYIEGNSRLSSISKISVSESQPTKRAWGIATSLSLSKIRKDLSRWELYFFASLSFFIRCLLLWSRFLSSCVRSSVRVLTSTWKTWLCAIKSACLNAR